MERQKLLSVIADAKEGDSQAFNTLFTETYNDVYYFALKTVKNETLAADITQETFVTIFQNLNGLNDPVAYPAWSRQITYRHCLQHLKKQNREIVVDENEDGSNIFDIIEEDRTEFIPEENLDKENFKKTILDMVDSLPTEQRTAVILYYFDELSVSEIAEIQGVTVGTVKSRLNYGRKAIKSSVEDYENKHNIKLHSISIFPLLLWLFKSDAGASVMPSATANTVATGVSTATGTTVIASTSTTANVTSTASIIGKIVALPLATKIIAGAVAAILLACGVIPTIAKLKNEDETKEQNTESLEEEMLGAIVFDGNRSWTSVENVPIYMFANASTLPYYSKPDELSATDAFWYAFLSMVTVGQEIEYEVQQDGPLTYMIPVTEIHKYMKNYLGQTYDCSGISGATYKEYTADYVAKDKGGEPVIKITYKTSYQNTDNLHFKILRAETKGDPRTIIACWYDVTNIKPEDDADWYYDGKYNRYYVAARYCKIVLKSTIDEQYGEPIWHVESYLPTQQPQNKSSS